ncbi:MAG: hypothetical protein H6618_06655 [Deltaproteobacteria bacterium]|nr:hypothetical protein [Deltaproteobacteria bacterium]
MNSDSTGTWSGSYIRSLCCSLIFFALSSGTALAGVHFTLQSSLSVNNLALTTQDSRSGSASVALDLGTYFRIGFTHRQSISKKEGYVNIGSPTQPFYIYTMEQFHLFANSVELTVILYYGRIFVPYIQVGMVKKNYLSVTAIADDPEARTKDSTSPEPSGGVGLGIRLNKNFSLKLSYTVSQGLRQDHPALPREGVLDSDTSVGISYSL